MSNTATQPQAIKPLAFELELTKMDQGIQKNLPGNVTLLVNGTPMKQSAIDTQIQAWIGIFQAVDEAKQKYRDAVNARLAVSVQARTFFKALKAAIKSYFGNQSPLLSSFGIAMDKPRATTAKDNVVAAAKRQQTRDVRGTMGKKQKAAVKPVSDPEVSIGSDGTVQVGAPVVKVGPAKSPTPGSSGGSTPAGA